MKKIILGFFGYQGNKTEGVEDQIHESCLLNVEAKERLAKLRATLDGEHKWFDMRERSNASNLK